MLAWAGADIVGQPRLQEPIACPARPAGRVSAFAFLKRHGCDLLYFPVFLQTRETRLARPRLTCAQKKPGAVSRSGGWRSFDEYAFLEDSRYASQAESGSI
jgi:hypothetical protein